MSHWIFGAMFSLIGGFFIGYLNYLLMRKNEQKVNRIAAISVIRQILHVGYLLLIYAIAPYTPWSRISMLVGAVLGITLSLLIFTVLLVRYPKESEQQSVRTTSLTEHRSDTPDKTSPDGPERNENMFER